MTASLRQDLHLPAGAAARGPYDLEITPATAGWAWSSLRTLTLPAGGEHTLDTGDEEMIVVPLSGGAHVEVGGAVSTLAGRPDVFAGPTDVAYLPVGSRATLRATEGTARLALTGARTERVLPFRSVAAADVPVEIRGAGQATRQVRNFGAADVCEAGNLIAVEVITPGGNWSSYPAHKHDEASAHESELEEIYYYEITPGPHGEPGLGFHRTSASPAGEVDVLVEVRDRDTVLVPSGWHGPCTAAPGHDMYYLNVMAGPGERAWKITDHPDQAWIRGTWADQPVDPRLGRSS
ncbi:5-deoxy-glucuronate isomerase [Actinomycetospora sp. TBRC 11914]|uniref:5-deoxy-glucuronate isomerase n=1 Tax=Actinomycetospora sp. TBRC 11914 TaxID=2729387 RepID=UPI00145C7C94|nr:5-deoxy-glucuronate isomerase [Actinomycetospora sp. TBRC 11914]NMO91537.1 5-deoxy-glucuronate isomerase [Actinomycetospora sp. TBRC 11914]